MTDKITDLKPAMIAYLKTTQEPVFILDIKPLQGPHVLAGMLSGVEATVRRPTLDEHGKVEHKIDRFFIEELESREDASTRKIREMEAYSATRVDADNVGQPN